MLQVHLHKLSSLLHPVGLLPHLLHPFKLCVRLGCNPSARFICYLSPRFIPTSAFCPLPSAWNRPLFSSVRCWKSTTAKPRSPPPTTSSPTTGLFWMPTRRPSSRRPHASRPRSSTSR